MTRRPTQISPASTSWTARRRRSVDVSRGQKPAAPAFRAWTATPSSSVLASTIVFARPLSAATIARPFASGLGPRSKRMTEGSEAAICLGRSSPAAMVRAMRSAGDDAVLLDAEPADPHLDDVARLQIARRLHAVGDAGGRARRDQVARAQRHELAHVGDQRPHAEDHVLGVAALARLAVDGGPHLERLRVADLVRGDEPGPDRCEGVGALALGRGAGTLHLERAL